MKTPVKLGMLAASLVFAAATSAGELLTGKDGLTLYTFSQDAPGQSACSWYCIRIWPPAYEGDAEGPELGTITREGGARQLTYHGKPLYYFAGDRRPGDANGAGIDQAWHVVLVPPGAGTEQQASRNPDLRVSFESQAELTARGD